MNPDADPFSRPGTRSETRIRGSRFSRPISGSVDTADPGPKQVCFFVIFDGVEIAIKLYSLTNDSNIYNFTIDHPK